MGDHFIFLGTEGLFGPKQTTVHSSCTQETQRPGEDRSLSVGKKTMALGSRGVPGAAPVLEESPQSQPGWIHHPSTGLPPGAQAWVQPASRVPPAHHPNRSLPLPLWDLPHPRPALPCPPPPTLKSPLPTGPWTCSSFLWGPWSSSWGRGH